MVDTAAHDSISSLDSLNTSTVITVLDALPVPAFLIESDRIYCNCAAERFTGYDRSELSSPTTFISLLFPDTADELHPFLKRDVEAPLPASQTFSLTRKDGRSTVVEIAHSGSCRVICTMHEVAADPAADDKTSAVKAFRKIADGSTDAFMLVAEDGKITDANEPCLQTYGYSREDFLGLSLLDLESMETGETAAAHLEHAMQHGHGRFESRHSFSGGRIVDIEARFLSLPGLPYIVMFVRDIAELKREEQKRVESEALLKAILDSVPFDFFALDRDGRYTVVSLKTLQLWGDPVGKTVEEFAGGSPMESYIPRWMDSNRRALAGETIDREFWYEWEGKQRIAREVVAPIRDLQQRILGSFGINIDITQHKLTQKALRESEERYRRFSELTSDYVYCCARSGNNAYRVQWLGGAIEAITGYSDAEIFERGCWIYLVHPEDRDRVSARLMALKQGESRTDEFRIICKNGEVCWIRESSHCEAGGAEGELLLYGAAQNITAGKNAEISLKNIEEIFRLFLEHSPAYVVFKDENFRAVRMSRNFENLLGRPLDELLGKTTAEVYPGSLAERIMHDDLKVLEGGKPVQSEEELGGRYYASTRFVIPQKDKPSVLVAIKTEITARREAEDALCRLNDALDRRVAERTAQLEAAILEQESFSYSVSHDLRAPLRHINSFSAILLEDYSDILPDQARDYLTRICKATNRMGLLIDNLLKLSRVSRTVVKLAPVSLTQLANKISLMLKEIEPDRLVEFRIAPAVFANCDKILVRQLFENLMGNAWKYTAKVPVGRIEVGMVPSAKGPIFFVKDNGAGFDMSYKDKLFVPFQRLHGSEYEGDGIGLATAQRIVQRHGGTIWAEGAEGRGATFYFTLSG